MKPKPIPHLSASDVRRFDSKYTKGRGCWLWTAATTRGGYGEFGLGGKMVKAHRVAFTLAYGQPTACVLHRCDVRACVRPSHLFGGTKAENNSDRATKGRSADQRGERHPNARLTEVKVREIKRLLHEGQKPRELGPLFGVDEATVYDIRAGRAWTHVKYP